MCVNVLGRKHKTNLGVDIFDFLYGRSVKLNKYYIDFFDLNFIIDY